MSEDVDARERPPADGDEEPTAEAAASTDDEGDDGAEPTGEALAVRVADHDESLAEEVRALGERVDDREAELAEREEEIEDLTDRLKRKQADFQNYKKRAKKRREQLEARATEDLVARIVEVRDNLVRALDQDDDADLRDGLEGTLREFDRILADENVTPIEPEPGEPIDPERHEVLMRVESGQPDGTVAEVYRPGYEMAEKVIQTAQITVSDGDD